MRALSFSSISFAHCPREVNQVARHLAKYSYESNSVIRWDGDPPSFIKPHVMNDVTLLINKARRMAFPKRTTIFLRSLKASPTLGEGRKTNDRKLNMKSLRSKY
jgi:hypothetical protein